MLNAVSGDNIDIDLVKLLAEKGANINAQDSAGFSALHFCAQENLFEIAEYLISEEAEIDLKDSWGNTPLMRALDSCYAALANNNPNPEALVKFLLKAGADRNSENNYGVKAIDSATDCDRDQIKSIPFNLIFFILCYFYN